MRRRSLAKAGSGPEDHFGLLEKIQPSEVFLCPIGLVTNHPLEKAKPKGLAWAVESNCDPSSIRMAEALVAPSAISQGKSVLIKRIDNLAGGYAAEAAPGHCHQLNGDCHSVIRRNVNFF